MIRRDDPADSQPVAFSPEAKCCSYIPTLPNFIVGLALEDGSAALDFGRATLAKRIENRHGVTPLGLSPPASFSIVYDAVGNNVFGRTHALQCPHYSTQRGGTCGIWLYRNSTCSTYFCKYERGANGYQFWTVLRDLLRAIEDQLSFWCVNEIMDDGATIAAILEARSASQHSRLVNELLAHPDTTADDGIWGQWKNRQVPFFVACGQRVHDLSWDRVRTICGAEVDARARRASALFRDLRNLTIPDRVTSAREIPPQGANPFVPIVTHSTSDPLSVPSNVYATLHRFDGRPTNVVREELRGEGVEISDALMRSLLDYGILSKADTAL